MGDSEEIQRTSFLSTISPAGLSFPLNEAAGEKIAYQLSAAPLDCSIYLNDDHFIHAGTRYQLDFSGRDTHVFAGTVGYRYSLFGIHGVGGATDHGDPVLGAEFVLSDPVWLYFTRVAVPGLTFGYRSIGGDANEHSLYVQLQATVVWDILFAEHADRGQAGSNTLQATTAETFVNTQ